MVLTAIADLGDLDQGGMRSLVDKSDAEGCIAIIFDKDDYSFMKCELSANQGEEKYLYHKDKSGKPGLFLSWTISATEVEKLRKLSKESSRSPEEEKQISAFWDKKFGWFSNTNGGTWSTKNKMINDTSLMRTLDNVSRSLINGVCESYANSFRQICSEVEKLLKEYVFNARGARANKLLVTIALREGAQTKYPGDIDSFVKLFTRAVLGEASGKSDLVCSVCNRQQGHEIHKPTPLEFLTQDQLVYIPDGNAENKSKAIALCQECSDKLHKGEAFINAYLSFKILKSKLFFWLVPVAPDLPPVKEYLRQLGDNKRPLYLHNLKRMCEDMEVVEKISNNLEESAEAETWLTFTSVFCYKDSNGHTRVAGIAEGVYPSRLRELTEASRFVQRLYPYFLTEPKVKFSFPLLSEFFTEGKGKNTVTQIMESLFTDNPIDSTQTYYLLAEKVRSAGLTRFKKVVVPTKSKMRDFVIKTLNAYIVMEFLMKAGILEAGQAGPVARMENTLNNEYVNEIQKFIASHEYLHSSETARSVFLTGVAVGVLLEVQMKEFESYPFWKHLNRLELDVSRIISFYPQVKAKLVQYSKGKASSEIDTLRPLIEYIGASLNFEQAGMTTSQDLVDLLFSIGLSEGYLIYHKLQAGE